MAEKSGRQINDLKNIARQACGGGNPHAGLHGSTEQGRDEVRWKQAKRKGWSLIPRLV